VPRVLLAARTHAMALRSMRAPARAAPRAAHRTHTASRRLAPPHAATPPRSRAPQPPPQHRSPRALAALPPWAAALAAPGGASSGSASASASANASAPSVIRAFYAAINARDLDAALACIDEECVYEDMIYAAPFEGKAAVAAHFRNVFAALPPDMAFVVRRAFALLSHSACVLLHARALTPAHACARGRSMT
jgi:hypothetical protein